MDLTPFVDSVRRELAAVADPQGEHREVAERMAGALTPAIRLMLLNALAEAAEDISVELAPGSVEVRLRGGEPSFAVEAPPAAPAAETEPTGATTVSADADDGPMTRINLRLSERLKERIEAAAEAEGRSANSWLVRAAASVLEPRQNQATTGHGSAFAGKQRLTGWAR